MWSCVQKATVHPGYLDPLPRGPQRQAAGGPQPPARETPRPGSLPGAVQQQRTRPGGDRDIRAAAGPHVRPVKPETVSTAAARKCQPLKPTENYAFPTPSADADAADPTVPPLGPGAARPQRLSAWRRLGARAPSVDTHLAPGLDAKQGHSLLTITTEAARARVVLWGRRPR